MSVEINLTNAQAKALAAFLTDEYVRGYRSLALKEATLKIVGATQKITPAEVARRVAARRLGEPG